MRRHSTDMVLVVFATLAVTVLTVKCSFLWPLVLFLFTF